MKRDWRKPFLELKAEMRPLYDANLSIDHAVLLSTSRTAQELPPVVDMLEPAYRKRKLAKSILVDTDGCTYHGHVFFANDRLGLNQLVRLLDGIEEWLDLTPSGFLPGFQIPPLPSQTDRNLLRWISVVYYLASASDAPYLDVEVEYQRTVDRIGFFPWFECPKPPGCRPLDWLTHRSTAADNLARAKQGFEQRGEWFPDVVDAFLTGELLASSLAAIDLLVYVIHGERKERSIKAEDYAKNLAVKKRGSEKADKEVEILKCFLLNYHNPWENTDLDVNVEMPLTADQIAEKLGWWGHPRTVASRVSRRMKEIFGKDPMKKYRQELAKGIHSKRPEAASLLYHAITEICRPISSAYMAT